MNKNISCGPSSPPICLLPNKFKPGSQPVTEKTTTHRECSPYSEGVYSWDRGDKKRTIRLSNGESAYNTQRKVFYRLLPESHQSLTRLISLDKESIAIERSTRVRSLLITEPVGKPLSSFLTSSRSVSKKNCLQQLQDISSGICFLKKKGIFLYKITPNTVWVTGEPYLRCKLFGFDMGVCSAVETVPPLPSPCYYRAPEISGYRQNEKEKIIRPEDYKNGCCESYSIGVMGLLLIAHCPYWQLTWDYSHGELVGIHQYTPEKTTHTLSGAALIGKTTLLQTPFSQVETQAFLDRVIWPALKVNNQERATPEALAEEIAKIRYPQDEGVQEILQET